MNLFNEIAVNVTGSDIRKGLLIGTLAAGVGELALRCRHCGTPGKQHSETEAIQLAKNLLGDLASVEDIKAKVEEIMGGLSRSLTPQRPQGSGRFIRK